ncbi:MAG: T9SS type A sorting domain-containing protein [Bacillota bacterium]|nr:T9SS type A sorting domain-containing protein [Bacillota bacterium]
MKKVIFTFYLLICSMAVMYGQTYAADGNVSEWVTTPIQSEPGVYPYFRFAEENNTLFLAFYAEQGRHFVFAQYCWVDVFFDSDRSKITGYVGDYNHWPAAGLDYLIQGASLLYHNGASPTTWGWDHAGYIVRTMTSDNTTTEYSVAKSNFNQNSLEAIFGISFQPYYEKLDDPGNVEAFNFPVIDAGFSANARNIFKIKNRTTLDITTALGLTDTIKLNCTNAFYNPYMNDPDTDNYLNFQNGTDHAANPRHWASWAINLATPQIFDLRMTYQSTAAGQISLSFVNMATNVVAKTFSAIDFSTNGTMSETKVFQIDASDIPAGHYMVVLKNSATDSNLKVQNLKLTKGTGAVSKWDNVPIQSEPGIYPYFKFAEQNNTLYWAMYAAADRPFATALADIFIDADYSTATGYLGGSTHWTSSGLDYLLQGTMIYYFSNPDQQTWGFTPIDYGVIRTEVDSITLEYSSAKSWYNQVSLGTTLGMGLQLFPKAGGRDDLPGPDDGFTNKKTYKVKNRTTLNVGTLGLNDTIKLNHTNAFYNPYMNDPDEDGFLNFQYGIDHTANPRHWASWAINLTPQKFDLRMTYTSTAEGQISLSFVDMKTNLVAKTFSAINYSTNATMSEIQMSQIDVSDIPAGYYMVVLKNSATDSNLKVQNLKFTKATSVHVDEVQPQKDVAISVNNKQLTIESKSDTKISFSVYTVSGALISQMDNTNSATLHLERGAYILSVNNGGNVFSKKIMVL